MEKINEVKPFCAYHYNPARINNIGLCLSEPYDVISAEKQEQYYLKHKNNVIRLILGKIEQNDNEKNNRYTRALEYFKKWEAEGVIIKAEHPSFYIYEQYFTMPDGKKKSLKGFVGLLHLSDYSEGKVLPHEKVLKHPVEDRIQLTLTTNTQFEYIWGLYEDKSGQINKVLENAEKQGAILEYFEPESQIQHKLFRLTDSSKCKIIQNVIAGQVIYIADGHHRYQTMLNIREEMRKRYPTAGKDAPWEYIMMFLVDISHEEIVILPTHRLVNSFLPEITNLEEKLKAYFNLKKYPIKDLNQEIILQRLVRDLNQSKEPAFGIILENIKDYFLLAKLKNSSLYLKMIVEKASATWKMLDVNVLNILILQNILGLTDEMMALQKNLYYCKDEKEALGQIQKKEMQAAFLLRATPLADILAVAKAGEKMPRKSTYFYPKPLSGLVFYRMEL